MKTTTYFLIALATFSFNAPQYTVAASDPNSFAIDEVAEAVAASRDSIASLSITVERFESIENGRAIKPMRFVGKMDFAFSDDRRYLYSEERRQSSENFKVFVDGELNAAQKAEAKAKFGANAIVSFLRAYDGTHMKTVNGDSVGTIESQETKNEINGSRFDSYYLRSIGWFVSDPMATDEFENKRKTRFLPTVFIEQQYTISRERFNEIDCVKLEGKIPGELEEHDTIWLDSASGYSLVRRDFANQFGKLLYQIKTERPVNIIDGVWLPKVCVINEYTLDNNDPKVVKQTRLHLTDWTVNDVPNSRFSFDFPPNALITDYVDTHKVGIPLSQPIQRITSADGKILDTTLRAVGTLSGEMLEAKQSRRWLIWLNVAVVITLLAGIIARRWNATSS